MFTLRIPDEVVEVPPADRYHFAYIASLPDDWDWRTEPPGVNTVDVTENDDWWDEVEEEPEEEED